MGQVISEGCEVKYILKRASDFEHSCMVKLSKSRSGSSVPQHDAGDSNPSQMAALSHVLIHRQQANPLQI